MNNKKIMRKLIFLYRSLKEDYSVLETEKEELESEVYNLKNKLDDLTDETEDLQNQFYIKTNECNDLIDELREIVKDRENDEDVIYNLTDRIQDLENLIREKLSEHAI